MTKTAYAAHRKVTPARISQLIAADRIIVTPDGKVDVDASDRLLEATTDYARKPPTDDDSRETVPVRGRPAHRDRRGRSYQDNRRDLELWKAKSAETAYRKEAGELVEWSAVVKALGAAIGPLMGKLEMLPNRVCRVVNGADARAVQTAAERIVQDVRNEMAGALRQLAHGSAGETRQ